MMEIIVVSGVTRIYTLMMGTNTQSLCGILWRRKSELPNGITNTSLTKMICLTRYYK